MDTPFVTEERPKEHIVLIVDKENQFGGALAATIQNHATVVLVSEKNPENTSLIYIPYNKRVPEIPVGTYSHIFLFAEGQDEHDLLLPLAQKANNDNAKFVYVLPYWLYRFEITERLASLCKQWMLVLMGDVFDSKNIDSHIGQIFQQAKTHKSIALPDLGLETLRPVAFVEAIDAVLRIGFGLEKQRVCFIFSKHPFTALSVVHALQKVDPLLRIDFVSHQSTYPSPFLPEGLYLLESDYPALKKIQDNYQALEAKQKTKEEKIAPVISKKAQTNNKWKSSLVASFVGLVFLLVLPLLWTVSTTGLGSILLDTAKTQMEKGNFAEAQKYAQASSSLFEGAQMGGNVVAWEATVVGQGDALRGTSLEIHSLEELSQVVVGISEAGKSFQQVGSGKTLTPQATFNSGVISLKNALLTLQSMAYLPKNAQNELISFQPLVTLLAQTIDVSPTLFGLDRSKTYLLLLQNNAELRPGGGLIDYYAVIKVENGKIGNIDIHKVSDADMQLKGHVEPPFALRRYMTKEHWYLKDSNFSADNLKNAQTEAFFIQQELGVKADGVITMDMDFVKNLLAAVGSIHITDYNETVTPDNLFLLTQSHIEKESSSPQTKVFLPMLLTSLQKKIQLGKVSYTTLGKQIIDAFTQKHLMVAFPDVTLQQLFTINNMSSALWDPRKSEGDVVNDFTGISEANIGQNQVNQFLKRSITQDVTLNASGTISATVTIHYDNTSDEGLGGGVYKNYFRILVPQGAQMTNISLNNTPQSRFPAVIDPKVYEAKNFKAPKGIELEHTQEGGKEEYGFVVTVPSKSMLDVAVSYTLAQKLDLAQTSSSFDELLFKQPGTEADPYTFTLTYPNFLTLITGPREMKKTAGKVIVANPLTTDMDYQFTFSNQ